MGDMEYMQMIRPAVMGTVAVIALIIFAYILHSLSRRGSSGLPGSMSFMDVEQMRKKGLISEQEYKHIRSKLAQRELERSKDQERIEKERGIIAQVEQNPALAHTLLTHEELEKVRAREAQKGMQRPGGQAQPAAAPSMNMPRVAQARMEETTEGEKKKREIDILLEKGAITRDEYDRLKKFFE